MESKGLTAYNLCVGFSIEPLRKHRQHKQVYNERYEQSDRCFDEEVFISFFHSDIFASINITRLKQKNNSLIVVFMW